jgi:uncharacterized protein
MSALIIRNAILPKFRRGDFAGGIKDGVRDIKDVVLGDAEEVKRRAATGTRAPQDDATVMLHIIIFLAIIAFIIWVNYRNAQAMRAGMPGSPRRRGGIIVIPGGSGDWGGGGWSSGGGDSGGGWSGGGGDFGGGGASGDW